MELHNFIIINNEDNIIYNTKTSKKKNKSNSNIISNNTNILENEYIILLDYKSFTDKIYNSFNKNYKNIYSQFSKDFHRAKYKINNLSENDMYLFTDYFEFLIYQYGLDYEEFLMLCTQAVMGCPLEILYKIINNVFTNNSYYIGEISNNNNSNNVFFKKYNINKNLVYNYVQKNNNLHIIIKKTLRIFYINSLGKDITVYYVNIKLNIPYYCKEKIIITYKILRNK